MCISPARHRAFLLILKWTVSKLSGQTSWELMAGVKARGCSLTPATAGPLPPICFYPKTSCKQKFALLEKHFSGELRSVFSFPDFNPFVYLSTFRHPNPTSVHKVFPPLKAYPWRAYHNQYFGGSSIHMLLSPAAWKFPCMVTLCSLQIRVALTQKGGG